MVLHVEKPSTAGLMRIRQTETLSFPKGQWSSGRDVGWLAGDVQGGWPSKPSASPPDPISCFEEGLSLPRYLES